MNATEKTRALLAAAGRGKWSAEVRLTAHLRNLAEHYVAVAEAATRLRRSVPQLRFDLMVFGDITYSGDAFQAALTELGIALDALDAAGGEA